MKKIVLFLAILLLSAISVNAQNPGWINYTNGDYVNAIAIEGDYIWAGTNGGLVKINHVTDETIFLTKPIQAYLIIGYTQLP
ncbi:MAG: hypothetical protein U9Q98_11985 [Bacteroidota bacterium]|nr:hypothetical protein [Bacteroidota bacterium]